MRAFDVKITMNLDKGAPNWVCFPIANDYGDGTYSKMSISQVASSVETATSVNVTQIVDPTNSVAAFKIGDDWFGSLTSIDPNNGYGAYINFTWKNEAATAKELTSHVFFTENLVFKKIASSFLPGVPTARQTMVVGSNDKAEWLDVQEFCNSQTSSPVMQFGQGVSLDFLGFDNHYFLFVF